MSQIVTCPDCGHVFEVDYRTRRNFNNLPFEKYEWKIAKLTNGALTDRGEKGIDVVGNPNETTYQVKSSEYEKKDKRTNHTRWCWGFHRCKIEADFVVFFYTGGDVELMFLLPSVKVEKHLEVGSDIYTFSVSNKKKNWIWDYYVSPENFMARVAELKASQQLALEFTQGLGD